MTKKKITSNHNMSSTQPAKRPGGLYKLSDEYRDFFTLKMQPVSDAFLNQLSIDLTNWALKNDDATSVSEFFFEKHIPERSYRAWLEKHVNFEQAYHTSKHIIANRLFKNGLKKNYDSSLVRLALPMLSNEWKQLEEWRSKLNADDKAASNIKVIVEAIPDSKIVPVKDETK